MFSIPLIIKEEKNCLKNKYKNIIFTILGIAIVFLITYFNPVSNGGNVVDITNLNLGLIIYIFISAMIAISAMVLPGISGSTLLLIFGLYMPIMNAIKEFLHLNFSYFPILVVFGLGVLTGIVLVIKLIKISLEKFRIQTVYLIIEHISNFSIIFFIVGGIIIYSLEKIKVVLEKRKN